MVAASAVLLEADCLQGWYGSVNLLNDVCHHSEECTKVGMRKKCTYQSPLEGRHRCVVLDSDLPFPRSAFLTFPFEAYLDSPGRTQHDQRRLVPSAQFPDKSDGLGKWSMLRILIKNTFAFAKRKSTKLNFWVDIADSNTASVTRKVFFCNWNSNCLFISLVRGPNACN